MARLTSLLIFILLLCSLASADAQKPSCEYPVLKMPAWHAQAITVALREFQKNQRGKTARGEPVYGDLRRYAVHISQSPPDQLPLRYAREECVRIEFDPELSARDRQQ